MHTLLDERDKVEIESQIQKISNNSIVSKKAGSSIVVNDSAGNKPRGLRVLGKTEQKTYTGKNLCRVTIEDGTVHHGVTFTVNSDRSIILNGTPTEDIYFNIGVALLEGGVEYTISGCPVFDSWDKAGFYVNSDALSGIVWNRTYESTFAMPDTKEYICTIQLKKDLVLTNVAFYPMIRLASITDSTYEPYVGGIPSPNPEYHQELISAGKDGNVEVGLYGKNLFDPSYRNSNDKIFCEKCSVSENNGVFTITATEADARIWNIANTGQKYNEYTGGKLILIPVGTTNICVKLSNIKINKNYITYYDENRVSLGYRESKNNEFSQSVPNGARYFSLRFGKGDAVVGETYETTVMVNYAQPMEYEPYIEQSLTFSTPNGLPGIPVSDTSLATYTDENGQMYYADEVDFERKVYIQRVYRLICDGSENWRTAYSDNPDGNRLEISTRNLEPLSTPVNANDYVVVGALCNALRYHKTNGHPRSNSFRVVLNNTYVYIEVNPSLSIIPKDDVAAWKECLNKNNMEILLPLATPIETPLPEEEIAQYKKLTMNHPTTTILNDSNAHMEVSYVANTQNHIEQNYLTKDDFESLKTRISSIANNII